MGMLGGSGHLVWWMSIHLWEGVSPQVNGLQRSGRNYITTWVNLLFISPLCTYFLNFYITFNRYALVGCVMCRILFIGNCD